MNATVELKGLQSQLTVAKIEAARTADDLAKATAKHQESLKCISDCEFKIARLQEQTIEPIVSEHAILRWLERVDGVNMDNVRAAILGDGTAESIKFAKTGKVVKNKHTIIFKNKTVVTVE